MAEVEPGGGTATADLAAGRGENCEVASCPNASSWALESLLWVVCSA